MILNNLCLTNTKKMPRYKIEEAIDETFRSIRSGLKSFKPAILSHEIGTVKDVSSGIATVVGLPGTGYEELLQFPDNLYGIAFNLDENEIGVVLLGNGDQLRAGDSVFRTNRITDIPVGEALLGRVVNPLGEAMDGKGPVNSFLRYPVERPAPPIMHREAVNTPLQTGITVIDAIIPIGRGQRELILGDRQTGKTSIAIDTILNQKGKDVLCVYCAIAQRSASVAKVINQLTEHGAMEYTTVVVSEGYDPPGLVYITPYAATSIAEYFMEQGRDVLIVYDDLTHHARAYRELSLMLRRPPGREAFPGDIFYIHSRLLERSTHLNDEHGGGSLTALPIIETEGQNISAYIPTNLISITDGQLYLSPRLFELGILPAVDVATSVSRVGGKAQLKAYREVSGNLKLAYAQFEELESFIRFGTRVDENTQKIIDHGNRIRACFGQAELNPVAVPVQIMLLLALTNGLLENVPLNKMKEIGSLMAIGASRIPDDLLERMFASMALSESDKATFLSIAEEVLRPMTVEMDNEISSV